MEQLWAPWRLEYVKQHPTPTEGEECFICRGLTQASDRENLIVWRTPLSCVFLNRFPYNNGHLLVAPNRHVGNLEEMTSEELLDGMETLRQMTVQLRLLMQPQGFNVGLNLGKVAGAGLPGHLHWHVVPRWNGDTNFMPIFGDTKVIVQSLESLYDLLTRDRGNA